MDPLAWPCSQGSQEHSIIGFTRTVARVKKCYPGKYWRFKNVQLKTKNIWFYCFRETVMNFKGLGELRLHQDRIILREEWWVGGSSLLRILLQQKDQLVSFPTSISPPWILPCLSQQKSVFKWDFPTDFFFPLRSHHFPKRHFQESPIWMEWSRLPCDEPYFSGWWHGQQNPWFCW